MCHAIPPHVRATLTISVMVWYVSFYSILALVLWDSFNRVEGFVQAELNIKGCYKLISLQPVDMFPHTPHIECVCLLELMDQWSIKPFHFKVGHHFSLLHLELFWKLNIEYLMDFEWLLFETSSAPIYLGIDHSIITALIHDLWSNVATTCNYKFFNKMNEKCLCIRNFNKNCMPYFPVFLFSMQHDYKVLKTLLN